MDSDVRTQNEVRQVPGHRQPSRRGPHRHRTDPLRLEIVGPGPATYCVDERAQESFPLDPVIFTGIVPLDEYMKDRPEEYRFLKDAGHLKKVMQFKEIAPRKMLVIRIFGFTLLVTGISLVGLIIYSMLFGYK